MVAAQADPADGPWDRSATATPGKPAKEVVNALGAQRQLLKLSGARRRDQPLTFVATTATSGQTQELGASRRCDDEA